MTGDFTCPSNAQVYLTATGGNPGLAATTNNSALAQVTEYTNVNTGVAAPQRT